MEKRSKEKLDEGHSGGWPRRVTGKQRAKLRGTLVIVCDRPTVSPPRSEKKRSGNGRKKKTKQAEGTQEVDEAINQSTRNKKWRRHPKRTKSGKKDLR